MPATKNNYDTIARYYDFLSGLVFGKSLMKAQTCLLPYINDNDKLLIAGGGTGKLLEEINRTGKTGLNVVYLDASSQMLCIARKRKVSNLTVEFVHSPVRELTGDASFDIIITPFLFDNFSIDSAKENFVVLDKYLRPGGYWLFADFRPDHNPPAWHKLLLKVMYRFFKIVSSVEADHLPDTESLFQQHRYHQVYMSRHYCRLIRSEVWQKEI